MAKILADRSGADKARRKPAAAGRCEVRSEHRRYHDFFVIWPHYLRIRSTLGSMRFVLLTAAFLTVASLLFNGFANSRSSGQDQLLQIERLDPVVALAKR